MWSLPVLAYKLFMLLWSLLLAVNLVGYLPWAYRAFSEWGLWRPIPPLFRRKPKAESEEPPVSDVASGPENVSTPAPVQAIEQDQTLPQAIQSSDPPRK